MNHGSLFSGIGGFDLAAQWMGWNNVFHCEWNPFGQKVLKHYWPKAISYADITKTDFSIHRGTIDILTGGFPCQPFSAAGKRKGKEDDRYLWPEMLRAINEIRPTWICGENVAGLISMVQPEIIETYMEAQTSILEEDSQEVITEVREYVIETICSDLERIGYSVQPIVIPACATGAPHRRDRVWFIANSDNQGLQIEREQKRVFETKGETLPGAKRRNGLESNIWSSVPGDAESIICRAGHGISNRVDRIKALGNAIVPQIAYQVFKAIEEYNNLKQAS